VQQQGDQRRQDDSVPAEQDESMRLDIAQQPLSVHEVTVFEALHKPGGVLVYGIPKFRLPK
jgi:hypothetical protein